MTDQAQKPPAKPSIGANPPGPVPITSTTGSWLLQLARYGLAIVALVAAGVGGVVWWLARDIATENAYVVGNVTPISPEVAGNVVALFTDDNMVVKAGEPLLQIDPVPHQLAVEEARADYRQALKELEGAAITVRLTDQDRKAGYQAAEARRQEQEESLRASALEASARDNILNKEKETLQASRAEEPGLQALFSHVGNHVVVYRCSDADGKLLAFRACAFVGDKAWDLLAATAVAGRKSYASYAAFWALMQDCHHRGVKHYDLSGIDPAGNRGVYDFKQGTGATPVEYTGEWEWAYPGCIALPANWLIGRRGNAL